MARILLVGPDRERAAGVRGLLRQDGHQVVWLKIADRWPLHEREIQPDLIVAAIGRADRVLGAAHAARSRRFPAPLLLVQQDSDFVGDLHDDQRLVDRLASPFSSEELLGRVDALARVRRVVRRDGGAGGATADTRVRGRGLRGAGQALSSWLRNRLPQQQRPSGPYLEVAARVAEWTDRRDAFRPGHAERVSSFSGMIAEGLGLGEHETESLLRAAMLHDIGKVGLPHEMLHQRGPLEESQRRMIRTHPARGAALLRALDPNDDVARVVLYHHERPDGNGYYSKLPESVPRAAFALAVAEAFDAMISSQLREPLSQQVALDSLLRQKGESYDADSVEALVDSLRPRKPGIDMAGAIPVSSTLDMRGKTPFVS